ncbi:protein Dr1-like [Octopus sinensis]|uniref:Protein Dr1 n=1 Tax=Octopus sinensis TaxID=2607531 RepID=A0A6P7TQG8_9MOLL|nr:protein Dr1-like [Octopus sinensis]
MKSDIEFKSDHDDVSISQLAVNKAIKDIMPDLKLSTQCKSFIRDCCTTFVHSVAAEAAKICDKAKRKTINEEILLEAVKNIGFPEFSADARVHCNANDIFESKKLRKKGLLENSELTIDELLKLQTELFDQEEEMREDPPQCFVDRKGEDERIIDSDYD